MHHKLLQYIHDHELFEPSDTILVAVSGGIDSMCLLHTLQQAGIQTAVAHCNFKLRDKESDKDAEFISAYCQKHRLPVHIKAFETESYAREQKISIQEAARELRYLWFEKLRVKNQYSVTATAHNKNDTVETMLINLARGTGIRGLTGIKPRVNRIVRPLLFATRAEIEAYAQNENIAFREDSSNAQQKYTRNKIRHSIIPLFQELNPHFLERVEKSMTILHDIDRYLEADVNKFKAAYMQESADATTIKLRPFHSAPSWMQYAILCQYGFNAEHAENIQNSIRHGMTGNRFLSRQYELIIDRDDLLIRKQPESVNDMEYTLHMEDQVMHEPVPLRWKIFDRTPEFKLSSQQNMAFTDVNLLKFPLQLRKWKDGDYFYPLGMEKPKKLSDFFIDEKIPRFEKENIWLLTTKKNEIIWVINYRIDNRFKITDDTRQILKIECSQLPGTGY